MFPFSAQTAVVLVKQETLTEFSSLANSRPDFKSEANDKFEKRKHCKMPACKQKIKTKCCNCSFCDNHSARLCQKCYRTHIELPSLPYSPPDFKCKADDKSEKRKRCKVPSCNRKTKTKCHYCLKTFCDDHSARLCQKCYEKKTESTSV